MKRDMHTQPLPAATKLLQHSGMTRGRVLDLSIWLHQHTVPRFFFIDSDRIDGSTMRATVAA
jgi:hypothetical protein